MKKIAACALLLLLAGGAWWTAARIAGSTVAATSPASAVARAKAETKRIRRLAAESAPAATGEIPPGDLDKCDRALDLLGRVIDEEGKPVAGAAVGTLRDPWREVHAGSVARWLEAEAGPATRTAKDGTFAVRLERGERFSLRVTAEPFGEAVRADCQA